MTNYLYIHVPFCKKKCLYCDFYSIPFDAELAARYVSALCMEIASNSNVINSLKTIYIGGGTPAMLGDEDLQRIMLTIKNNCSINKDAETTIEANPQCINEEKAYKILAAGINRISIGVQSLIDDELSILGRSHTASEALDAIETIKKAGFQNISIDLIYGIPGEIGSNASFERDLKSWEYSLIKAVELNPEHISIYELTPEADTPIYNELLSKKILMPDEQVVSEMYYRAKETLESSGYVHYEISNFAKPGYECIHNLNYWSGDEYLGIGAGAHSFINGTRYSNVRDVHGYIIAVEDGRNPIAERSELNPQERVKELVFLGLRKIKGIELKTIPAKSLEKMQTVINELIDYNLLELKNNHLRLSNKGLMLSSEVMTRLMDAL